jgi:hypothetical protein
MIVLKRNNDFKNGYFGIKLPKMAVERKKAIKSTPTKKWRFFGF